MKVKKIAALAIGAAMVGATIGFASAQPTVPEIPKDFFVKDGQPNVKIVVGSQGAALDVSSAADIAVALGSMLYTEEDVSVKDASVVVKKDTAYDPEDIPVASYYAESEKYPSDAFPTDGWWNGAWAPSYPATKKKNGDTVWYFSPIEITVDPVYGEFATSAWADGAINQSDIQTQTIVTLYNGTASDNAIYYKNPMEFTVEDALYWKLAKPVYYKQGSKVVATFDEGYITDYTVDIKEIKFDENEWDSWTNKYGDIPPQDIKLAIPANAVNVTINYQLNGYDYKYRGCAGVTHHYYFIQDWWPDLRKGAVVGDTIDIFGNQLEIVDIKTPNFLGDEKTYDVVFGKAQGEHYIDAGSSKTFGDYTVKVVDIDVNNVKALLEVSGPEGTKMITLDTNSETSTPNATVLFGGAIRVQLLDTFIGIGGTTSAKVKVWTDLFGVTGEDDTIYEGWTVHFNVEQDSGIWYLKKIWLTNNEELRGDKITLFDKFVVDYKSDVCTETDEHGDKYYSVDAWIAIDPLNPEYTTETLAVGDEIDDTGYIVDKIEATTDPEKAAVPSKITTPITVLDTEVMEAGLDSVDSNLILIGGPVVNSVTAALADKLGVPSDYDGWKSEYGTGADSGVIKYIAECGDINGYGVVLVAGTDREGTKAAAEALMEYLASL